MNREEAREAIKEAYGNTEYTDEIIKTLEQESCEGAISKTDIVELLRRGRTYAFHHPEQYKTEREADIVDTLYVNLIQAVDKLPPINPHYTDNEIQKMQDLEQAEIEKAYELGKMEVQKSEDAISREDALMALTGEWTELTDELIHRFIKRIKALPPVNPQPKTGHWINGDCEGGNCSICGEYYAFYPESGDFNYCPNCGRRMIEPRESESKE